jgi:hypothetical protein
MNVYNSSLDLNLAKLCIFKLKNKDHKKYKIEHGWLLSGSCRSDDICTISTTMRSIRFWVKKTRHLVGSWFNKVELGDPAQFSQHIRYDYFFWFSIIQLWLGDTLAN